MQNVLYLGASAVEYNCPLSTAVHQICGAKRRKVVFGNIPTWYNEYVVSFNNNGERVALSTRRDYGTEGVVENLYIVYAQNSGEILEFIE